MPLMKRILLIVVAFPTAIALITLAIANRHPVRLVLDPFRPDSPAISIELPLYAYLFAALIAGALLGGCASWFSQGRWRHAARVRSREVARWQAEADRLTRERDQSAMNNKTALAT